MRNSLLHSVIKETVNKKKLIDKKNSISIKKKEKPVQKEKLPEILLVE